MISNTALRLDIVEDAGRSAEMFSGEAASMMTSVASSMMTSVASSMMTSVASSAMTSVAHEQAALDLAGKLSGAQTCLMTSVADI
ncbi:MAG: hypothetical protein U0934_19925 [Pseudotabrizicola sp.]|uniref:hypothetical protein n=1 Tax=Pseudotabrizicola sp. TaxID=2939647 RepID=UPI002ACDDC24|nr:hypothetical protein [Pseudotabrizicola sp.]MDZ7576197.1 hypothetical protein [Pseudotabrizicola sp.]